MQWALDTSIVFEVLEAEQELQFQANQTHGPRLFRLSVAMTK